MKEAKNKIWILLTAFLMVVISMGQCDENDLTILETWEIRYPKGLESGLRLGDTSELYIEIKSNIKHRGYAVIYIEDIKARNDSTDTTKVIPVYPDSFYFELDSAEVFPFTVKFFLDEPSSYGGTLGLVVDTFLDVSSDWRLARVHRIFILVKEDSSIVADTTIPPPGFYGD